MTELSRPQRWRYEPRALLQVALVIVMLTAFGGLGWSEEPWLWPLWLALCALAVVYLFHLLAMLLTRVEIGADRLLLSRP